MQTTANLWEVLCRDLESERQSAKAEQYHEIAERFLQTARQILRPNSPKLGDAIEISADICQAAGKLNEAVTGFEEALLKALELGHMSSAARIAAKLALLQDHLGDARKAKGYYDQALAFYDSVQDHSQHSMLLTHAGALAKREGDMASAEAYYLRAMEVATLLHGNMHPEVAVAANNLGVAYSEAGKFEKAENLHMQALGIREKSFGATHPEVAQSMGNLAVAYHTVGNLAQAESFYRGALNIYARFRGPDDPEVQTVQANLNALLKRKEKAK